MDWILENWQTVVAIAGAVVMVARLIVKLTPTPADDAWLAKVLDALKVLALYLGDKTPKPPAVVLLFFLPLLALGGCAAGAQFRMDALAEVGSAITELQRGVDEAQVGLLTRLDQEEGQKKDALVLTIGYVLKAPDLTPEQREAQTTARLGQFWAQWAIVQQDRANGLERFKRMAAQAAHGRLLLARLYGLETQNLSVQAQLEQYRVLAEDFARQKVGLIQTTPK